MNNKIKILTILSMVIVTILSGCVTGPKTIETPGGKVTIDEAPGGNKGEKGSDWCQAGMKITSSGPQGTVSFTIKGITTYKDVTNVCEAEYIYDQGSMVQYFNEKGDYMVIVNKDKDGKVVQEMNIANPNP